MKIQPKIRNAALVGALAAAAATAWATHEPMYNSTLIPAPTVAIEAPVAAPIAPAPEAVVATESLSPNEAVVSSNGDVVVAAPVVERRVTPLAGVTIEERRLSEDERIQAVVMDRLANNPRLSGKIGVESNDAVVTLTGYTRTVGQAWHAERDARSVIGVKYVQNQIRPRVGGSV